MTGPSVPDDDMVNFPWRSRADVPPAGDPALDSLLASSARPENAADTLRPVAEVLAALRAAPDGSELRGFDRALTAFRAREAVMPGPADPADSLVSPAGRHRGGLAVLRTRLGARLAAAAVAVAAIGGVSYAGALPPALQRVAHETLGAPAAMGAQSAHLRPTSRPSSPAGHSARPAPAGPATRELCDVLAHGNTTRRAAALNELIAAAGGRGRVAAFCAAAQRPVSTPPGKAAGRTGPTPPGKAASHPPGQRPSAQATSPENGQKNGDGNGNGNGPGNGNGNGSGDGQGNGQHKGSSKAAP